MDHDPQQEDFPDRLLGPEATGRAFFPRRNEEASLSPDMRSILEAQTAKGQVLTVEEPVSYVYSTARIIHDHQDKTVVFRNVQKFDGPVVSGISGSREKVAAACGVEPARLVDFLRKCMDRPAEYRVVGRADFLSNVTEKPDLGRLLPVMRFYPQRERRYFTSTIVAARNGLGGTNYSFHRMMLLGGNRLAVRVVPRHLHAILERAGGTLPAVVFCGVHPAVEIAAATSVEPDREEVAMASAMLGGELDCVDLDGVMIPAHAEIVMTGRFTGELEDEGPFVDLTSTYDDVRPQPVFEVDRLCLRDGALYRTILPGGSEHRLLMGLPQEPRMLRVIAGSVPSVVSVVLTEGGCSWLHAVVSITKRSVGEGRSAGLAARAAHPSLKRVVVVDDDIDPSDPKDVEWALATRLRPDKDIHVLPDMKGSSLDPSRNPEDDTSAKWILDATVPHGRRRESFAKVEPPGTEK